MQLAIAWKNKENRKPLILKGARQVGKTWLMKEFGRTQFKKVAYITFYSNQRMKRVFDDDYDINRIIMNINIEAQIEVTPEDTLIIFDEIQDAPRALESLKYFCENAPEYALIADTEYTPYYHISDTGKYEMDFMIQKGRNVVPVEVKAETNLRAKRLQAYHQKYEPAYAVRISMADYRQDEWLTNIPLYAVSIL